MNAIQKILLLCLLLSVSPFFLQAQSLFREGEIIYQADTVRRLERHPAVYIATQLVVYRKADATRLEVWKTNYWNPADTQKEIHVRNLTGTYTWIEFSDSTFAASSKLVMFVSYEEENQLQRKQVLTRLNRRHQPKQILESVQWLGLPAERITLAKGTDNESEAVVTKAIDLSLGSIFPSILTLSGTPLQFTNGDGSWLTHYSAKTLNSRPIPDQLFVVDPSLKVMNLTESRQMISDFD
ncbi:hypothetical protein CDA63_07890 [Hymenobacter amundsenii]|uniref:Uncharacterized protein n=1 Tax=Hymenobacter amundsenii TaxID=2006685 RepID=A0A246FLY4_9BACT|nr:hypothetical protein [Hymenobacter amundsenii]OWP63699.1 hypothetical protein CDA63_07890 [Hymenobacter amundsenii]